jgi:bifunctional non-homologous end joining protein LigD
MLATASALPGGDDWAYEFKWDGVRALAYVDGGRVRLLSRTGRDITVAYPEVREIGLSLGSTSVVLDGEIVAMGPDGRPSFAAL